MGIQITNMLILSLSMIVYTNTHRKSLLALILLPLCLLELRTKIADLLLQPLEGVIACTTHVLRFLLLETFKLVSKTLDLRLVTSSTRFFQLQLCFKLLHLLRIDVTYLSRKYYLFVLISHTLSSLASYRYLSTPVSSSVTLDSSSSI